MDVCCAAGDPVRYDYEPKGSVVSLGAGLEGYLVAGAKPAAIVVVYDIFGYSEFPQVKQVADRLSAATGFTVCIPDVFRGQPWPMSKFPPKPEDNLIGWITTAGGYGKVSKDVAQTVEALRARGGERFGILGCCWGVSIAMQACAEADTPFAACGGVHPSLFGQDKEFASAVRTPVALVSAKGDPLETVQEVLEGRPELAAKCVWKRMDDMTHGFCAARGDFEDENVCRRVAEAVQLLGGFYTANVA